MSAKHLEHFEHAMPSELFLRYKDDPYGTDKEVRERLGIPSNRYYCVTTFPEHKAGTVTLSGSRHVRCEKISKSDQV